MIHLDTNFLVAIEDAHGPESKSFRSWLRTGEEMSISSLAWTEYLCGPLPEKQIEAAGILFPNPEPYLAEDSVLAARMFHHTGRRRGSMLDCMIAAIALRNNARLATLNIADFRPFEKFGLHLVVNSNQD